MLPDLVRLIGSDRYLTAEEVERASEPHSATAGAWDVYTAHFQGFTGATLDPDFARLAHPATRTGRVRLAEGTTVLVVGSGPSLAAHRDAVKAIRERVRIFASPAGDAALRACGLAADLVVVDYPNAVTARHAVRRQEQAPRDTLVAADWRTPAAVIAGVPAEQLFVPAPAVSWGRWAATAVAMAADARATRIALVGIDLDDTSDAPLKALLELLARLSPFIALDCTGGTTPKRGWVAAAIDEIAGVKVRGPVETNLWAAPSSGERASQAHSDLVELAPVLDRAQRLLALAEGVREMEDVASTLALEAAIDEIMGWRHQIRTRTLLQETLGASFLPRLWRSPLQPSLGRALRRPLLLATHELTRRADALAEMIAARRAA
jgi:hypothetical protein